MEKLSHDLNLALEESNCMRQERRKLGLRRRTRSTGNLPTACVTSIVEDCSSSSPPQAPIITQPLSDSDDCHVKGRNRWAGAAESDSLNENASPTRHVNARRKRKYKRMAVDCAGSSPPLVLALPLLPHSPHAQILAQGLAEELETELAVSPANLAQINKKKRILKQDRMSFCGKRKWSHRDRDSGEMRERSFSGGCNSKSYFFGKTYADHRTGKKHGIDKAPKFKDKLVHPSKIVLKAQNLDVAKDIAPALSFGLPTSSSFNFVYRNPKLNSDTTKMSGFKVATNLPPVFDATEKSMSKRKSKKDRDCLRNPFEDGNSMDCQDVNEAPSSSSLSSSDSDGPVTNDSDREGDDELTDWPGSEDMSAFNKNLSFKTKTANSTKSVGCNTKTVKNKFLPKYGLASCKNKTKSLDLDLESRSIDEDAMMSDSNSRTGPNLVRPDSSFFSFNDIKNAGPGGNSTNENFYHSFREFEERSFKSGEKTCRSFVDFQESQKDSSGRVRSNFSLQKTSSSDLNVSERSPQSDHCYSEHSAYGGPIEVREIRAGCRRVRESRAGFVIVSSANEQLARFLQDSVQRELRLGGAHGAGEPRAQLDRLAQLYSLELAVEMGRPVLRKTNKTTQAVKIEGTRGLALGAGPKRRCYAGPGGTGPGGTRSDSSPSPARSASASPHCCLRDHH